MSHQLPALGNCWKFVRDRSHLPREPSCCGISSTARGVTALPGRMILEIPKGKTPTCWRQKAHLLPARYDSIREARPPLTETKGLVALLGRMLWQRVCRDVCVIGFGGGRVALNRVEKIGKSWLNGGVIPFDLFSYFGGDSPEASKDKATLATRPLPQDRQRPSTASKESACKVGRAGRTGRKDRANDRCLFFAGRQTVSTPTRDLSFVSLDPSQKLTKALPRHLSVHKTPSHITQKRSRATMQPAGDILSMRQAAIRLEEEASRPAPLHAKRCSRGH
jgi:hypothetical protein